MEGSPQQPPRSNLRPSGSLRYVLPLLVVAAAGAYGLYRWLAPADVPPSLEQPAVAQPDASAAPSTAVAAAPDEPPATAAEAPALLERVSPHPLFRKGIALPEPIRRWAVVIENLAQGDSPRRELGLLAPRGGFSVEARGDGLVVAPRSWARYDEVAAVVQSVDARAAASAYRRLHRVLEAAFQVLGYRAGSLDAATARALRRLADAPLAAEDTRVVKADEGYVYEDQQLEQLPEVEKHLLRMGPRNERIVQAKARELLAGLNLPVVASKP